MQPEEEEEEEEEEEDEQFKKYIATCIFTLPLSKWFDHRPSF